MFFQKSRLALVCGLLCVFPKLLLGNALALDVAKKKSAAAGKNVLLRMGEGAYLAADSLVYEGNSVSAEGSVRLCRGRDFLLAEKLHYSLSDGIFRGEGIRFCSKGNYVEAESVEGKRAERIVFRRGRFYRGEPERHSPNVASETITLPGNGRVIFDHPSICLGDARLLKLRRWSQSLGAFPFRLRIRYGHRTNFGVYGSHSIFCDVRPNLSIGADLAWYESRGLLFGPGCQWAYDSAPHRIRANLRSGWIRDRGVKSYGSQGLPIGQRRNFIEGAYSHEIGECCSLVGALHRWSDPDVLRDFRPGRYAYSQHPSSYLEMNRWWKKSLASATLVWNQNDFQGGTRSYQELRYQIIPHSTGFGGIYEQGAVAVAGTAVDGGVGVRRFSSADGFYELSRPFYWRNILSLKTFSAGRAICYHGTGEGNFTHRFLGQTGADLHILAEGNWHISVPRWNIGTIRHRLTPLLRYRHNWENGSRGPFAAMVRTNNLPIIDLGETRDLRNFSCGDYFRVGLENLFQATRSRGGPMRTIAELLFYEDIKLRHSENSSRLLDFYAMLRLRPAEFFSLNLFSRSSMHLSSLKELRLEVELWDGNVWKISFAKDFLGGCASQYRSSFTYQMTSRSYFSSSFRYDARLRRLTLQRYRYFHRFDRNWSMDAHLAFRSAMASEDRCQFRMGLHLDF